MTTSDDIAMVSAVLSAVAIIVAVASRRDGKRAAAAALRSAVASEQSADIAASGERAWVAIQSVQSSPDLREGQLAVRALVTLVNGKTLARDLKTWHQIEQRPAPPFETDYPEKLPDASKGILGPGESCQLHPAVLHLTNKEFREIVSGVSIAYLYGVAEYEDLIFKKRHRTCWCLNYVPQTKQSLIRTVATRFHKTLRTQPLSDESLLIATRKTACKPPSGLA